MRVNWISGGLLLGVLLVSGSNVSGQDRRTAAARRSLDAADSARKARDDVRDSTRLRTAAQAKRERIEAEKTRQSVADEGRTPAPAAERTPATTPGMVITPTSPAPRADSARAALTGRPGMLRIVASPTDSVAANSPRLSRPRAFVMRMSKRDDAPIFCQNGSGHPAFGRDWCWERGYRLGSEWRRERIRNATIKRTSRATPIERAQLVEMLGPDLIEQIEDSRTELQLEGQLSASWVESPTGGLVLRIQAGDQPIAEVADRNRDGKIDSIWRRVRR